MTNMAFTHITSFSFQIGSNESNLEVRCYKSKSNSGLYEHTVFDVRQEGKWLISVAYNNLDGISPSTTALRNWVQHYVLEGALRIPAQEIAEEVTDFC